MRDTGIGSREWMDGCGVTIRRAWVAGLAAGCCVHFLQKVFFLGPGLGSDIIERFFLCLVNSLKFIGVHFVALFMSESFRSLDGHYDYIFFGWMRGSVVWR